MVTTAFLNSSIGQLLGFIPADEFDQYIKVYNTDEDIKVLIKAVKLRAIECSTDPNGFGELVDNAIYGS